ncbi:MAG: ChaN family lipoprotein [bacterium]
MRQYVFIIFIIIAFPLSASVFSTDAGSIITFDAMLELLADYDVIVIGEEHGNDYHHAVELKIFRGLNERRPFALGLEMFERDVQPFINAYLSSEITEGEMLEQSRPWSNYQRDYAPLVNYAADNGLDVAAANIPRYLANAAAHNGSLPDNADSSLFDIPFTYNDDYKRRFMETMEQVKNNNRAMPGIMDNENLFKAQLLKDATMAHSIASFVDSAGSMLFITGRFHCEYNDGIMTQLNYADSSLKTAVIIIEDTLTDILSGDFIISRE